MGLVIDFNSMDRAFEECHERATTLSPQEIELIHTGIETLRLLVSEDVLATLEEGSSKAFHSIQSGLKFVSLYENTKTPEQMETFFRQLGIWEKPWFKSSWLTDHYPWIATHLRVKNRIKTFPEGRFPRWQDFIEWMGEERCAEARAAYVSSIEVSPEYSSGLEAAKAECVAVAQDLSAQEVQRYLDHSGRGRSARDVFNLLSKGVRELVTIDAEKSLRTVRSQLRFLLLYEKTRTPELTVAFFKELDIWDYDWESSGSFGYNYSWIYNHFVTKKTPEFPEARFADWNEFKVWLSAAYDPEARTQERKATLESRLAEARDFILEQDLSDEDLLTFMEAKDDYDLRRIFDKETIETLFYRLPARPIISLVCELKLTLFHRLTPTPEATWALFDRLSLAQTQLLSPSRLPSGFRWVQNGALKASVEYPNGRFADWDAFLVWLGIENREEQMQASREASQREQFVLKMMAKVEGELDYPHLSPREQRRLVGGAGNYRLQETAAEVIPYYFSCCGVEEEQWRDEQWYEANPEYQRFHAMMIERFGNWEMFLNWIETSPAEVRELRARFNEFPTSSGSRENQRQAEFERGQRLLEEFRAEQRQAEVSPPQQPEEEDQQLLEQQQAEEEAQRLLEQQQAEEAQRLLEQQQAEEEAQLLLEQQQAEEEAQPTPQRQKFPASSSLAKVVEKLEKQRKFLDRVNDKHGPEMALILETPQNVKDYLVSLWLWEDGDGEPLWFNERVLAERGEELFVSALYTRFLEWRSFVDWMNSYLDMKRTPLTPSSEEMASVSVQWPDWYHSMPSVIQDELFGMFLAGGGSKRLMREISWIAAEFFDALDTFLMTMRFAESLEAALFDDYLPPSECHENPLEYLKDHELLGVFYSIPRAHGLATFIGYRS